jgi:methylmalonyl-CoA mutase N-terminal domain/subunit
MGGMVEAVERGFPQREIAEASYRFQQAVESKEKIIVGVNDFVEGGEESVPILYIDETAAEAQMTRLADVRRRRDAARVERALAELAETARGTGNTMYPLLECVRAYATVGEMCDALRQVWGEYEEVPSI